MHYLHRIPQTVWPRYDRASPASAIHHGLSVLYLYISCSIQPIILYLHATILFSHLHNLQSGQSHKWPNAVVNITVNMYCICKGENTLTVFSQPICNICACISRNVSMQLTDFKMLAIPCKCIYHTVISKLVTEISSSEYLKFITCKCFSYIWDCDTYSLSYWYKLCTMDWF